MIPRPDTYKNRRKLVKSIAATTKKTKPDMNETVAAYSELKTTELTKLQAISSPPNAANTAPVR